jgi:hypothetical protein
MSTTPTIDELLDELAAELAEPEIPPNAITVKMLMERCPDKIEKTCRTLLEKWVKEGKMGVVKNKITKYYYPIK